MTHSILPLILRKRAAAELTAAEIEEFVASVSAGEAPDYQIGAMLMAIYFQGMTDRETALLTGAMVRSGATIDLSAIEGFKADKHSTGGVGDKVTPILGPLVASAGVHFPKLSGRGLGITGGTLDKLESIPGFRVDLSIEEFIRQVAAIGLAINGQTAELVPADGVLYSLRDVTGTIESIPLIASSVMSKKIAAGADGIVLDVKCGRGAFMADEEAAEALARLMVAIGEMSGKRTAAVVTSMDAPLGRAIGNALEIAEAISVLRGEEGGELSEVCLLLGAIILRLAGLVETIDAGQERLSGCIASGAALDRLRRMVEWQGGDPRAIDDPDILPRADRMLPVPSPSAGYVQAIDARQIAIAVNELGAGRQVKGEPIDHAVGVVLRAGVGDRVDADTPLATIHTNGRIPDAEAVRQVAAAFSLGPEPPPHQPHVLRMIGV